MGDIAWTLASTALVWIMIPGVGFFYSGLLRRKNALNMIYLSMMTVATVSFQVSPILAAFFVRLAHRLCSGSSGAILWLLAIVQALTLATSVRFRLEFQVLTFDLCSLEYFALRNVLNQPSIGSVRVPAIVFCVFQLMFAAIT